MKTFAIAFLTVVGVLAGSAVLAHQAMHHMMGSHMETMMMDRSMPGMDHGMSATSDADG